MKARQKGRKEKWVEKRRRERSHTSKKQQKRNLSGFCFAVCCVRSRKNKENWIQRLLESLIFCFDVFHWFLVFSYSRNKTLLLSSASLQPGLVAVRPRCLCWAGPFPYLLVPPRSLDWGLVPLNIGAAMPDLGCWHPSIIVVFDSLRNQFLVFFDSIPCQIGSYGTCGQKDMFFCFFMFLYFLILYEILRNLQESYEIFRNWGDSVEVSHIS